MPFKLSPGCPLAYIGSATELEPEGDEVFGGIDIQLRAEGDHGPSRFGGQVDGLFQHGRCAHDRWENVGSALSDSNEVIATIEIRSEHDGLRLSLQRDECVLDGGLGQVGRVTVPHHDAGVSTSGQCLEDRLHAGREADSSLTKWNEMLSKEQIEGLGELVTSALRERACAAIVICPGYDKVGVKFPLG